MNQEKVSVIMPVKNEELFIEATVESILEQRYPHFELLICDDNSTDRTNEMLKKIEAKDQRIRLFENTGKGIIDALKILEDNITSNWITRMDGDDLMPKHKLERFMERRREGVMVTGMVEYFSDKPISDGYVSYQNWLNQRVVSQDYGIHKYRECVVASANWLMSADTLRSIGGLTNNCYPEDYDLVLRALLHGLTIEGVPEVTHLWREYPERTSRLSPDYNQDSFFKMKALYIAKEHRGKVLHILEGEERRSYSRNTLLCHLIHMA